jgi:hypothetical protein
VAWGYGLVMLRIDDLSKQRLFLDTVREVYDAK